MELSWQLPARALHIAGLSLLWGSLLFRRAVLPLPRALALERVGAGLALAAGLAWFGLEAASIGDASSLGDTLNLLWPVATETRFGELLALRLALIAVALLLSPGSPRPSLSRPSLSRPSLSRPGLSRPSLSRPSLSRPSLSRPSLSRPGLSRPSLSRPGWSRPGWWRLLLAGIALGMQPLLAHAGAGDFGPTLPVSELLHVLAAGAWLGALPALWLCLDNPTRAAAASHGFAPLGLACVLILSGTGIVQGMALIGGLPGLLGTAYGHAALAKIALFALLLILASLNRFRLTARVEREGGAALPWLRASIALEMVLGAAVIAAAALLASQAPGVHETPVWPFAWRPSLDAWFDPDSRALLFPSIGLALGATSLVAIGLAWTRVRWAALILAAIGFVACLSGLSPLLVPAWPTSYATSPTGFAAPSIARGLLLYAANCTACHGADGHGDGKLAASRAVPPADLDAPHLFAHSDGELFWWIGHGMRGPRGEQVMPGIDLPDDDIWALIDAIRARNAGLARDGTGRFAAPIAAPGIDASCADGTDLALADWLGRVVRVVGARDWTTVRGSPLSTVAVLAPDATWGDTGGATWGAAAPPCHAESVQAWTAYATVSGLPDGFDCLIDTQGWLRQCRAPGAVDASEAAAIAKAPLPAVSGMHHHE